MSRNLLLTATILISGVAWYKFVDQYLGWDYHFRTPPKRLRSKHQDYVYNPLNNSHSRKIRLIELLPSDDDDRSPKRHAKIKLRTISLDDPNEQEYEAISYCWGDTADRYPVICEDRTLSITLNLHYILRRLQLKDKPRLLWADAICINQLDEEEKSVQVRMMADIYRSATCVLIYLGEDNDGSGVLGDFLPQFANAKAKILAAQAAEGNDSPYISLTAERQKQLGLPFMTLRNQFYFMAIPTLLNRPWFERVWVIQELAFAKKATVLCGSWELPWTTFVTAIEIVKFLPMSPFDIMAGADRLEHLKWSQKNAFTATMGAVLYSNRGTKASEAVDHIFALAGLAWDRDYIEIDYKKPISDVLEDTARHILLRTQKLWLLTNAGISYQKDSSIPSWVPDWSCHHKKQLHIIPPISPEANAALDSLRSLDSLDSLQEVIAHKWVDAGLSFECEGKVLRVKGIKMDTVAIIGDIAPSKPDWWEFLGWKAIQTYTTLKQWTRTFDVFSTASHPQGSGSLQPGDEETLYSAFLVEVFSQVNMPIFRQWMPILRIARVLTSIMPWTGLASYPRIAAIMQSTGLIVFTIISMPIACYRKWKGDEWIAPAVSLYMHQNVAGRRMIKSHQGRLGLAPKETKAGDHVFMLQGYQIPFIMRDSNSQDTYVLVGECTLHGMMGKLAGELGELQPVLIV
jgi:hypothetical protein